MPLSDTACKNAKPKEKPFKLADEKGMFLLVNPNGSKYFRFKYRFAGKEKTLALGVYPDTSLNRLEKNETKQGKCSQKVSTQTKTKKLLSNQELKAWLTVLK